MMNYVISVDVAQKLFILILNVIPKNTPPVSANDTIKHTC